MTLFGHFVKLRPGNEHALGQQTEDFIFAGGQNGLKRHENIARAGFIPKPLGHLARTGGACLPSEGLGCALREACLRGLAAARQAAITLQPAPRIAKLS